MMNYFAPKPAPRGLGFGPAYGERQPGWSSGAPNPAVVNPVRAQPWSPEVAPMPPRHDGDMTFAPAAQDYTRPQLRSMGYGRPENRWGVGGWFGPGAGQPGLYDRGYGGMPGGPATAGWGFGPHQQGWGGQAAGWPGFDRLVR